MTSIFTRIVRGEASCHKIAEDEQFLAFLDTRPINPGHTLVIPKQEVDDFFDLDDPTLAGLFVFAKPVAHAIAAVTHPIRVGIIVAGLDVPHAHVHLIPMHGYADLDFARARRASDSELAGMAKKIRAAMA